METMSTFFRTTFVGCLIAIVGCASAPKKDESISSAETPSTTPVEPEATSRCYVGTVKLTKPDGTLISEFPGAVVRNLNPKKRQIVEDIKLDPSSGRETYNIVNNVYGDKMSYVATNHSGEGELTGEPWNWHAWETVKTFKEGTSMTSRETLHDGVWSIEIDVFRDMKLINRFVERFEARPMEACTSF